MRNIPLLSQQKFQLYSSVNNMFKKKKKKTLLIWKSNWCYGGCYGTVCYDMDICYGVLFSNNITLIIKVWLCNMLLVTCYYFCNTACHFTKEFISKKYFCINFIFLSTFDARTSQFQTQDMVDIRNKMTLQTTKLSTLEAWCLHLTDPLFLFLSSAQLLDFFPHPSQIKYFL